jgi:hypothetical protein
MKSATRSFCVVLAALTLPCVADAGTTGYRLAVLDEIQMSSATSATAPAIVYLAQGGTWVGGPDCPTEWAYFDAKLNPHFMATILAAGIADRVVRVYVDDSLARVGGHCQITNLALVPAS